uniref:Rab5 GDP/GTP exchange factor n=1 Tax=Aceria tosichella TaxID=561515 RepID=A0A6G1SLY5_9ACAR
MAGQQHNRTFYLDQSSLQCKAGCGFFGNPEWFGYCSICFKQLNHYQQHQTQYYQQQQQQQHQQQQQQQQYLIQQQSFLEQQRLYYQQESQRRQEQLQQQIQSITKSVHQNDAIRPQRPPIIATTASTHNPAHIIIDSRHTPISLVPPSLSALNEQRTGLSANTGPATPSTPGATSMSTTVANSPSGSTSILSTSNSFLGNITSPTSLVQMGYDTLSNLHNTIVNTAKSSFRASPSASTDGTAGDNSSIHSSSQSEYLASRPRARKQWSNIINPSGSSRKGSLDQHLSFHYDMAWVDCLNQTNKFAKELLAVESRPDTSINDLSDLVHEFYEKMSNRFETQLIYKGASNDQLELLNDNMERILNEHIYHIISARIINEDEDHNMAVQKRIRSLNWITVEHLEIEIDFQRPIVHDLLDKAICQMVEMNSRTSSIDKLECIVQCSKTIFELLQVGPPSSDCGNSVPVSADQFLPVLVFVVIQANPPMLPADMKYLTRFSNPRRLMSGETGYYFTNLCCALEFIEKASGASLNISEEEFNRYINGEAVPETKSQFHTYLCDGLRTMCSNDAALKQLQTSQEARAKKMDSLLEQIDVHLETNRAKLREMKEFSENLNEKLKSKQPSLKEINKGFAIDRIQSGTRRTI